MPVSVYVIAGICGCFHWESTMNPGIWESLIVPSDTWYHVYEYNNIGGYGFGQFTNVPDQTTGTVSWRARDYYEWCLANNKSPDDGSAQMDYILNVERVWMEWQPQRGNYQDLNEFLSSTSTSTDDLVWDWLACWEGVPGDQYAVRCEFARTALAYMQQHANDDPAQYHWITGNFYCTTEQMLNNVMCMYFYMQGFVPSTYPGSVSGFVEWCHEKCEDPDVQYSREYREEETINGITYYDCSSFIWYGLAHNGFDIEATAHASYAFDTTAMPADLQAMGWSEIDRSGTLLPGDIGWTSTHAEVCYSGGSGQGVFMGAHSDQLPAADQVSVNNFASAGTDFEKIFRFYGGSPTPTPSGKGKKLLWMYMRNWPYRIY